MKNLWCVPGLISSFLLLCVAVPAEAGSLSSWQFNRSQNRLEFNTDEGVQPRAQLVANPTRLVIDLPGTTLGQPQVNQVLEGAFRQIRIAQFDAQTTRIVLELDPGYTLDPQQVQFRGLSPTQWTVQLPEPQLAASGAAVPPAAASSSGRSAATVSTTPQSAARSTPIAQTPPEEAIAQIEGIRVTADGIFVQTRGTAPEIQVKRSRDRRSITIRLENAVLAAQLAREQTIDRFGVKRLEFEQADDRPPTVEVTLSVDRNSPDWEASASSLGGIVLLPQGGASSASRAQRQADPSESPEPPAASTAAPAAPTQVATPRPATIQGIELNAGSNQLLIRTDRPVAYTSRWQSGIYQITLSPARLADRVTGPQLSSGSPLSRVRLRQEEGTVVLLIQPASGVRFGSLNVISPQLLALEFQRSQPVPTPAASAPAVSRFDAGSPDRVPNSRPNGRTVVIVDPGHGGSDPGAVGISDIQEKVIVLAIAKQVATYLEQQGIQAILTRTDDRDVELEPRVQMAEQARASVFVSIHANSISLDRPDVNGTETYYYSSGAGLAQVIQNSVIQGTGMTDRGIRQARFYVLRRTTMPAVLVEVGYVTGNQDQPRLANEGFRTQMAQAIARGILQYLQQTASGSR